MENKKQPSNVGEILDKEIHEYFEKMDAITKAETKILEPLEEKLPLRKKRGRNLLKLIPGIVGGVGAYASSHYGFDYEIMRSIGFGVVGAFGANLLYNLYSIIRHKKK